MSKHVVRDVGAHVCGGVCTYVHVYAWWEAARVGARAYI